ncbi:MAG: hypothetical protein JXR25_13555 [Pontiellaceae bacterium]|nr:hypothetical protein [Pontiellaceae bacterium]MBN2785842.1 hypothetical protein [Pontiellaceae bacterium]
MKSFTNHPFALCFILLLSGLPRIGAARENPPKTWKEHWFEHNLEVRRVYCDNDVAVYFDDDVDRKHTWLYKFVGDIWRYTKETYGDFGDGRLYAIFHADKYGGGHPSTWWDKHHDYRNVIDIGKAGDWVEQPGWTYGVITHEISHIVELSSKGLHGSPAFGIWGDSKWAEIFNYDVFLNLGYTEVAEKMHDELMKGTDNFPVEGTHWFRDWFFPIYDTYGGNKVLNRYFTVLSENFRQSGDSYKGGMNMGEFVYFWSAAAGENLQPQAEKAFGWTEEWQTQLDQAQIDYPNAATVQRSDITEYKDLRLAAEFDDSPADQGPQNLTDNNLETKFLTFNNHCEIRFAIKNSCRVTGYSIASANDFEERDPLSWTFKASRDNKHWVVLDERSNEDFDARFKTRLFTFENPSRYRFFSFEFTNNHGNILQISEIEILENR